VGRRRYQAAGINPTRPLLPLSWNSRTSSLESLSQKRPAASRCTCAYRLSWFATKRRRGRSCQSKSLHASCRESFPHSGCQLCSLPANVIRRNSRMSSTRDILPLRFGAQSVIAPDHSPTNVHLSEVEYEPTALQTCWRCWAGDMVTKLLSKIWYSWWSMITFWALLSEGVKKPFQ